MASARMVVRPGVNLLVAVATLLGLFLVPAAVRPAQAASATVVISELRVRGPSGGNDEFIELYNLSSSAVPIGGWKLKGSNSSATVSTRATVPAGVVLGAGCYYLLANNNASGGYSGSVTPDLRYGTGVTDDGGVALTLADDTIVDQVGLSSGSAYKEGTPLASLGSTNQNRGYARKSLAAATADTDNNSADFAVLAPSDPQNLASVPGCTATPLSASGAASPSSVLAGSSSLLTVRVTPGSSPTSSGIRVAADLTAIGGSATQALLDDGTGGDAAAGDNTFSYRATVDPATSAGSKSLPASVSDTQGRTAATTIALTVATLGPRTLVSAIQGASHVSPKVGQSVTNVQGIVTARVTSGSHQGFFLQDRTPDTDESTSEGIFVFASPASVSVGDLLSINATVYEYRPGCDPTCSSSASGFANLSTTELRSASITSLSSGNALPAPVVIGQGGRMPPTSAIEDDSAANVESGNSFDPAADGLDFYESLEGMRVQVNNAVVVGPGGGSFNFGEIPVLPDDGAWAGVRTPRGGVVIRATDFNPERVILDDAITPTPVANVGDRLPGASVGVLDYSFGNYKLLVTQALAVAAGGLARETAVAQTRDQLAIATFNVQNLDPTDGAEQFARLASLIVQNVQAPDILAIEEIQDNNGAATGCSGSGCSPVDASATIRQLIAAIQAAGGPTYDYRQIDPVYNADGGEQSGNIRQVLLFRTDRPLRFVDRAYTGSSSPTTDAVGVASGPDGPRLTWSPGRIQPQDAAFTNSRKPLAGEFLFNGQKVFVIANHLNSKGGDQPLFGRFQPPSRVSETQRIQQAQVLNSFVRDLLAADPAARIVLLGDLNDFEFSRQVQTIICRTPVAEGGTCAEGDRVLHPLVETLPQNDRYSYVFDGNSQAIDHVLVSGTLFRPGTFEYDSVHVNAEYADRASDHDPQLARLLIPDLTPPVVSHTLVGPQGANGWYVGDVSATWTATDPDSPLTLAGCAATTVTQDTAGVVLACSATSNGGTTRDDVTVRRDATPPTLAGAPTTAPNAAGWYRGDVAIRWTAADATAGVDPATLPADTLLAGEGESLVATASVRDLAGNSSGPVASAPVRIDRTAPLTQVSAPTGWTSQVVTLELSAADNLSGVKVTSYSLDGGPQQAGRTVSIADEGSHTLVFWSVDQADNVEAARSVQVRIDRSAPSITHTLTPLPNPAGWNNTDVTVSFTCSDAVSGLAVDGCTQPRVVTAEGAGQAVTGTATDNAGNTATDVALVSLDRTPPSVAAVVPTANANGWYNAPATVTFTCTDGLSGLAAGSCAPVTLGEGAGQAATGTATDAAGNSASATARGLNLDLTRPVLTLGGPTTYTVDQVVAVTCTASDALSGLAADPCPALLAGANRPASTYPAGPTTLVVEATDRAGNRVTATLTVHVAVTYDSLCALTTQLASKQGIAQSLCAKLAAAERAAERGKEKANTKSNLGAYVNEVSAQAGKAFTEAEASLLQGLAGRL